MPELVTEDLRHWLSPCVSGIRLVPVLDPVLSCLPAPADLPPVELAVEVHEALLESLERASDLLELFEIAIDLARHAVDLGVHLELLLRFTGLGTGLRRGVLVAVHELAPRGK